MMLFNLDRIADEDNYRQSSSPSSNSLFRFTAGQLKAFSYFFHSSLSKSESISIEFGTICLIKIKLIRDGINRIGGYHPAAGNFPTFLLLFKFFWNRCFDWKHNQQTNSASKKMVDRNCTCCQSPGSPICQITSD